MEPTAQTQQQPETPGQATPEAPAERSRRRGVAARLDAFRTYPAGRRLLGWLAGLLILAGIGLLVYPFATDIYTERVLQVELERELIRPEARTAYLTRTVRAGDPLTRIVMPDLGVDAVVVEGTSMAALRAGAGHYPNTPLPGERGNVAIAGHRTTYGRPFARLDELPVGAEIRLVTPVATHTYRVVPAPEDVERPCPNGACWVTGSRDWSVVAPEPGSVLTLTTCHPKGSDRERLILRAELIDSVERPLDGSASDATEPVEGT